MAGDATHETGTGGIVSLGLSQSALPAELMRGCRFAQDFWDRGSMLRDDWTFTNNPTVDNGITCDGVNQKAEWSGTIRGIQSVSFWITLGSTTEDILQLSAAHSIEVGAGTLTATGWAAPTIMVNGVVTTTITVARSFVTVTTATPFDADDIAVGEVAAYGSFKMEDLKIWARGCVLSLQEALDYTNNATWNWENLLKLNLQARTQDYDITAVRTLDSSGYGNHAQLGDGSTPATYMTQGAGRLENDGLRYLQVLANASLPAGTYTVLATINPLVDGSGDFVFDCRTGAGTGYGYMNTGQWLFSSGAFFVGGVGPYASGVAAPVAKIQTVAFQGITLDIDTVMTIFANRVIGSRMVGTLFDFKIAPGTLTPTQIMDYTIRAKAVLGSQL